MNDLRQFHMPEEAGKSKIGKIIGWAVLAVALIALGVYSYEAGMWTPKPKPVVSDSDLPSF